MGTNIFSLIAREEAPGATRSAAEALVKLTMTAIAPAKCRQVVSSEFLEVIIASFPLELPARRVIVMLSARSEARVRVLFYDGGLAGKQSLVCPKSMKGDAVATNA